jgi:hypothetical protein
MGLHHSLSAFPLHTAIMPIRIQPGYSPLLIVALTFFDGNSGHTKTARAMAGITAMKSSKLSWLGLDR